MALCKIYAKTEFLKEQWCSGSDTKLVLDSQSRQNCEMNVYITMTYNPHKDYETLRFFEGLQTRHILQFLGSLNQIELGHLPSYFSS